MTGAVIGSAVIGAGASMMASNSASNSADAAMSAQARSDEVAAQSAREQLDWAKEQQANWDKVFGPIQDNLSEYYQNLTPELHESLGVQKINEELAASQKKFDQALAQRGITNSGTAAAGILGLEQSASEARANVRATAPQVTAQAKQGFLQLGLGQAGGINQAVQNAQSGITSQATQSAQQYGVQANQYNQLAGNAMSGVGTSIGSGISNYIALQNIPKTPITGGFTDPDIASLPWGQ